MRFHLIGPLGLLGLLTLLAVPAVVCGKEHTADLPSPAALTLSRRRSLPSTAPIQLQCSSGHGSGEGHSPPGSSTYSRQATYTSSDAKVATVSRDGFVTPTGNGTCTIQAVVGGQSATAQVTVKDFDVTPPVSFRNQIVPVFTSSAATAAAVTARRRDRTASSCRCSASIRSSITPPSSRRRAAGASFQAPEQQPAAAQGAAPSPHGGGKRSRRSHRVRN